MCRVGVRRRRQGDWRASDLAEDVSMAKKLRAIDSADLFFDDPAEG